MQILEAIGADFIDESEVLTPADNKYHIDKHAFKLPFVCGAKNIGEALRRIHEGAAMIRTKGAAGTGDVIQAVQHHRAMDEGIRSLAGMDERQLAAMAHEANETMIAGSRMGCISHRKATNTWARNSLSLL